MQLIVNEVEYNLCYQTNWIPSYLCLFKSQIDSGSGSMDLKVLVRRTIIWTNLGLSRLLRVSAAKGNSMHIFESILRASGWFAKVNRF